MGTTEPIRDLREIRAFLDYYKKEEVNPRNALLISLGMYTGFRISDLLTVKWQDIYDFKMKKAKNYLEIVEMKTNKSRRAYLNGNLRKQIKSYYFFIKNDVSIDDGDYIFVNGRSNDKPICRSTAYRIVRKAAQNTIKSAEHISPHSMRKTLGYQAAKQGTAPVILMEFYNHSSYEITKRYLGLKEDELMEVYKRINY